ncbi:nucleotidyl transferase AbiEii/AbiGii toxin family protein [uncultured Thiothrix sp.]|uniref:nucleotidyl transferase AbiEii/AbiGii toxin family protein n=1 Tax=uncultured Thiothrix sp. TaxID=223185 RepID=UPI002620D477|nr:nucleotidyl transferase AbiEii/AbiGii toxin family protein [uncultured Thiothrix sp.]
MAMTVLEQMLNRYPLTLVEQQDQALREVMQEIALAGLNRAGFFEQAAFYGGTCLRIFYGLPRFSEDLDFSLLQPKAGFSLQPYFKAVIEEFQALGLEVDITVKQKTVDSQIESAFLKNNTQVFSLTISHSRKIKIKLEVDTLPPLGFSTEERLLLQPFSFYVKCFTLSDLFAGKLHALLFRQWKNRVKGRDWFDFEWYVRHKVRPNLEHFARRSFESGAIHQSSISEAELKKLLQQRIQIVDFESAKQDVEKFVPDSKVLNIWSKEYFLQLTQQMMASF